MPTSRPEDLVPPPSQGVGGASTPIQKPEVFLYRYMSDVIVADEVSVVDQMIGQY